jgi:hypothetical protein
MSKEDIIRMAREAGLEDGWAGWCQECGCDSDKLTRFAALVAAAERDKYEAKFKQLEAIMQEREQQPNKPCCLAEREACAKVCETYEVASIMNDAHNTAKIFNHCAAAIRARGQV